MGRGWPLTLKCHVPLFGLPSAAFISDRVITLSYGHYRGEACQGQNSLRIVTVLGRSEESLTGKASLVSRQLWPLA